MCVYKAFTNDTRALEIGNEIQLKSKILNADFLLEKERNIFFLRYPLGLFQTLQEANTIHDVVTNAKTCLFNAFFVKRENIYKTKIVFRPPKRID